VASPQLTVKLSQVLEAYITWDELSDFGNIFEVQINADQRWLSVARALTENLNQGNTRFLVDELIGMCETRNADGIAHQTWERRDFHVNMAPVIRDTRALLETEAAPGEITLPAGNPFSAKSRVRELLETSTGEIFVIDPYVGVGTLDCLRGLTVPIRLLTANHGQAIERLRTESCGVCGGRAQRDGQNECGTARPACRFQQSVLDCRRLAQGRWQETLQLH
jgi:hypothetical protein